jgi:hypothetical protein
MRMSAQREARASATQVTIASLEHQLSELRSQNAILQARLDMHPSKRSEEGGSEMRELVTRLEEEWRRERQAMNSKLEALKTNLGSKEIEALKATVSALQSNSQSIGKQRRDGRSLGNQGHSKLAMIREEGSNVDDVIASHKPIPSMSQSASHASDQHVKGKTVSSFKAPLPSLVEKGEGSSSAMVKHGGRKAKTDKEEMVMSRSTVTKPGPSKDKLERAPSQYRSKPVGELASAPSQVSIPDAVPRRDVSAVASHVATLLNSPKKKATESKTRSSKQSAQVAVNTSMSSVEQSKSIQQATASIPRLPKRALEGENVLPSNQSISATTSTMIHAAAPSRGLGISGISFDSIARKRIKLPSRDGGSAETPAPSIQTRTRANIGELAGTSVNVIPELMAAFNVNIPARKK